MKANILIIGLTKVIANQIKKELKLCTTQNSFEMVQYANAKVCNKKIKERDSSAIFLWEEKEEDYKDFKHLKKRIPNSKTILISNGKMDRIIEETNRDSLFRIASIPYKVSELVKFLEEAIQDWLRLQNKKRNFLRNDQETLQKELLIAQEIQKNLLPIDSPKWKNLELSCFSESAKSVGGDFYTYFGMQNDRALISKHIVAVGDVSGKGISAALLMATCISHIDNSMKLNLKLSERMVYLDSLLVPFTKPQKQNCALCMVEFFGVNTNHAFVKIVNAACIPPYIKRKDGSVEWVNAKGFALGQGIGTQFGYKESTVKIQKGDIVILVSDGIIEANNENNELLGFEAFQTILEACNSSSSKEILEFIKDKVIKFTNGCDQHDDLTIVVIKFY